MFTRSKRRLSQLDGDSRSPNNILASELHRRTGECSSTMEGMFSVIPCDIIRALALYLGPSRDLLRLQATNKKIFGFVLDACWLWFHSTIFEGFRSGNTSIRSDTTSLRVRFFETKLSLALFRCCGIDQLPRAITETHIDDEIVYFNLRFVRSALPVYVEITVDENSDNFSLALVDFDDGGKSSITFSPDTGVVIKEKKVLDAAGKVEGLFAFPLKPSSVFGDRFVGRVGIFCVNGKVAFTRKSKGSDSWETTQLCTQLSWLEADVFTPCIAFRDKGSYQVHISDVGRESPIACSDNSRLLEASAEGEWHNMDWDDSTIERI